MSDLISRSNTMKKLREYAEQKHYNGEIELANGILKAICFIEYEENIPTVFDTEKLISGLEEEKDIACADFDKYVNDYELDLDSDYDDLFHKGIERAIDVIRKGRVE